MSNSVDHEVYFLSSNRTKKPLSINIAAFEQSPKEFLADMEILGKVKHQNLVSLLGYCSYDEEKDFVYEYMAKGSLGHWLRNIARTLPLLDLSKQLEITLGSAHGMVLLHHGFTLHIIHRIIKASSIILDEEFESKGVDFGLTKKINACETHVSTNIAAMFGYIPPEYGQSWESTTKDDLYSFGMIIVELLTGKEPTGPEFKDIEGENLVGWVFLKSKNGRAVDVFDLTILDANSKPTMLKTLQIVMRILLLHLSNFQIQELTEMSTKRYAFMVVKLRDSHHREDKVNFKGERNDTPTNLEANSPASMEGLPPQLLPSQQPKGKEKGDVAHVDKAKVLSSVLRGKRRSSRN